MHSNKYTIIFTAVLTIILGFFVSTADSSLKDMREKNIEADIRKNIGIMLQDSWLFSGTIRENIQMGFNEYEDDHVLRICKIAGVDDFVGSQPKLSLIHI